MDPRPPPTRSRSRARARLLLAAAMLAGWAPAQRPLRIQPVRALQREANDQDGFASPCLRPGANMEGRDIAR